MSLVSVKMNFQMKHIIITMILLHADTFVTEAKKNSEIVFYGSVPFTGEDGFRHLERSCYRGKRQEGLEETS